MALLSQFQPHGSLQLKATSRNSTRTSGVTKSFIYSAYISSRFHPQCFKYYGGGVGNLITIKPTRFLPSPVAFSADSLEYDFGECTTPLDVCGDHGTEISYIDYLRHILHESARVISVGLKNHESSRNYAKLSKAWVGEDVDSWHAPVAYQAAVYALLKAVLELGELLNEKHSVYDILSPKIQLISESLDGQLSMRDPKLVNWFRMAQLPDLVKRVTLVLETCASHYVESAVSILAVSCCVAIKKLDAARISSPDFTISLRETIWELVQSSPDYSSVDILHHLATKSGVEHEFLKFFGPKVLDLDARGDIIFWMGLIQEKLVAALCRESVVRVLQLFCCSQVVVRDLAVIGLFAVLGRNTRLFLAKMGIDDLDETVKDFLCYLECGILFLYPDLSSMCVYQLFMDVVAEEIGWLNLYAAESSTKSQDRKRLKSRAIQAEKEIILSTVFGVCSNMFSGFDHYIDKTEQSPNHKVKAYIQVCKGLLTFCLEDYWAVYDRLRELRKSTEVQFPEPVMHTGNLTEVISSSPRNGLRQRCGDVKPYVSAECIFQDKQIKSMLSCSDKILAMLPEAAETKLRQSFFAKYSSSLLSSTSDICMGSKMLFVDVMFTVQFIRKQIFGQTLTKREKKKIARTLIDIVCVIPIAILMLLPVTAIGHAAMLSAIKKYIPGLIPSPYSTERLDVIKQLKRAKRMKVQSTSNLTPACMAL
ncbi:uncharacterized protein LOC109839962 isoform X2 [Asparagus officinalis]|uniref:uncharacterized protein LOC109839962 isoform X2 n=1 Tax=Asparagus officinalis TaxID=4686 RepID=UPI00098DE724|nr:uncharacterized protein LOC109839962 isoform X2 [Asparagus officinalis]